MIRDPEPDGEETAAFWGNLNTLQATTYSIPLGATVKRALNIDLQNNSPRCSRIRYAAEWQGGWAGADSVLVTRVDARTWDVATQAAPSDRALCFNPDGTPGSLISMPLRLRIVSSWDLP